MARIQNQFTPAVQATVTKVVSVRFSEEILAEVDQQAESENRTRSNMIIELIQRGLEQTADSRYRLKADRERS